MAFSAYSEQGTRWISKGVIDGFATFITDISEPLSVGTETIVSPPLPECISGANISVGIVVLTPFKSVPANSISFDLQQGYGASFPADAEKCFIGTIEDDIRIEVAGSHVFCFSATTMSQPVCRFMMNKSGIEIGTDGIFYWFFSILWDSTIGRPIPVRAASMSTDAKSFTGNPGNISRPASIVSYENRIKGRI